MPANYSRRRILAGFGAGLSVGMTGCSGTFARSRTRIGELVFLNMDDVPHDVRVQIRSDNETIFEATQRVPPGDEPQPVLTQQDGIPKRTREYTVSARLDGGADSIQRTYPTSRRGDCYSVTVRIDFDGTFRDMPSIPNFDGCSTME